jgi:alpha-mannosidase
MWNEIEQTVDEEIKSKDDQSAERHSESDEQPRQILKNSQPQKISKFMIEKLEENEKMLAEQVNILKQLESKDKKIKKLQSEQALIHGQTVQLMQKLSAECLEDD